MRFQATKVRTTMYILGLYRTRDKDDFFTITKFQALTEFNSEV